MPFTLSGHYLSSHCKVIGFTIVFSLEQPKITSITAGPASLLPSPTGLCEEVIQSSGHLKKVYIFVPNLYPGIQDTGPSPTLNDECFLSFILEAYKYYILKILYLQKMHNIITKMTWVQLFCSPLWFFHTDCVHKCHVFSIPTWIILNWSKNIFHSETHRIDLKVCICINNTVYWQRVLLVQFVKKNNIWKAKRQYPRTIFCSYTCSPEEGVISLLWRGTGMGQVQCKQNLG